MITAYDAAIIGFYFLFVIAVGVSFRRLSKNTSDYFRAGGAMPWWITGTSAWIATFSAWTFVGAAGKAYETGTLVLWAFWPTAAALLLVYATTALRFRRTRVITWMEAVRRRYGPGTEQFYTWLKVPLLLLAGGISLNAVGVFMASVFGLPMNRVLIILGTVVTTVALLGGAWAVLASDFVQSFLMVTIAIATSVLALAQPKVGGIRGLLHQLPASRFHWEQLERPQVLVIWILAQVWFKFSDANSIENSTMYLMAKSDRDARRMVLIPMMGSLLGPLIYFVPPLVAVVTHPHLRAEFPNLGQPHEAAFVAVAHDVMPVGLMGLLVCAMMGATLTSMDAAVNKGVGVFVRSFYCPLIAPHASEKHLLRLGKICTFVFGAIIVVLALQINKVRTINLFDLSNLLAATLLMPMALPLVWGLFVKRTPGWAAWSTALVGFAIAYCGTYWITPQKVQHWMGWVNPLKAQEAADLRLGLVTVGTAILGSAWYFTTTIFYDASSEAQRLRIDHLFADLATPINQKAEGIADMDQMIYRMMGLLCLVFGAFVLLLAVAVPNPLRGRLCFVFCGGTIFLTGLLLYQRSRTLARTAAATEPGAAFSQPLAPTSPDRAPVAMRP